MNKLLLLVSILFVQIVVEGQTISGKLTDENQNCVPYVNIGIVGLNRGTISAGNGRYSIDISGIENNKILRFSCVGFEPVEFNISELRSKETLDMTLKKNTVKLQEVVVLPGDLDPVYIGSEKRGRMAWIWSEARNGAEIGTLFRNDKAIVLDKFYFHIRKNYCDSILYRIRIYDGQNEYPDRIINTKDIRFISRLKRGWDMVSLSNYNITVDGDFILTLETLESWTSGNYRTTHLSVGKAKGALSYSRASSMAPWQEFGNPMSFRIEIKEYRK